MIFDEVESRIVFQFECKFGVKKQCKITYEQGDDTAVKFSTAVPNMIVTRPRIFLDAVQHLHGSIQEISLHGHSDRLVISSVIDEEGTADHKALLRTEITVNANEFETFQITKESPALVFTLKEFRALLLYAEQTGQPITIYFEQAGEPIVFNVSIADMLRADFVFATLVQESSPPPPHAATAAASSRVKRPVHDESSTPSPGPHYRSPTPYSGYSSYSNPPNSNNNPPPYIDQSSSEYDSRTNSPYASYSGISPAADHSHSHSSHHHPSEPASKRHRNLQLDPSKDHTRRLFVDVAHQSFVSDASQ